MSICIYCQKNVGLFATYHRECEAAYQNGKYKIERWVYEAAIGYNNIHLFRDIETTAQDCHIRPPEIGRIMAQAWSRALDYHLRDGILSPVEKTYLDAVARSLRINPTLLIELGVPQKVERAKQYEIELNRRTKQKEIELNNRVNLISSLREGHYPTYPYRTPQLPILFQKGEMLVWLFENVTFCEEKTRRETVRQSHGFSYHGQYAGQSHSQTKETTSLVKQDCGVVIFTSKHFYFGGSEKQIRLPYAKIVGLKPYQDAIEIIKDGASPKKQVYFNIDGIFAADIAKELTGQSR